MAIVKQKRKLGKRRRFPSLCNESIRAPQQQQQHDQSRSHNGDLNPRACERWRRRLRRQVRCDLYGRSTLGSAAQNLIMRVNWCVIARRKCPARISSLPGLETVFFLSQNSSFSEYREWAAWGKILISSTVTAPRWVAPSKLWLICEKWFASSSSSVSEGQFSRCGDSNRNCYPLQSSE